MVADSCRASRISGFGTGTADRFHAAFRTPRDSLAQEHPTVVARRDVFIDVPEPLLGFRRSLPWCPEILVFLTKRRAYADSTPELKQALSLNGHGLLGHADGEYLKLPLGVHGLA